MQNYALWDKMNKKRALDKDIVSWVVEEAFVKDNYKIIKSTQ